jgi:hypothetical protein
MAPIEHRRLQSSTGVFNRAPASSPAAVDTTLVKVTNELVPMSCYKLAGARHGCFLRSDGELTETGHPLLKQASRRSHRSV